MQKIFLIVRPTEDSTWFEYQAANKILARKPFVEFYWGVTDSLSKSLYSFAVCFKLTFRKFTYLAILIFFSHVCYEIMSLAVALSEKCRTAQEYKYALLDMRTKRLLLFCFFSAFILLIFCLYFCLYSAYILLMFCFNSAYISLIQWSPRPLQSVEICFLSECQFVQPH
jgi:hypothetical protein